MTKKSQAAFQHLKVNIDLLEVEVASTLASYREIAQHTSELSAGGTQILEATSELNTLSVGVKENAAHLSVIDTQLEAVVEANSKIVAKAAQCTREIAKGAIESRKSVDVMMTAANGLIGAMNKLVESAGVFTSKDETEAIV